MTELGEPIRTAAGEFRRVVLGVRPDQLAECTPCAGYDIRGLLNHLLYWSPRLAAAARKEPAPPADGGEEAARLVEGDWAGRLLALTDDLVGALGAAGAGEGTTTMGGDSLPAAMVERMALCEFVLHGWDLAMAARLPFDPAPAVAEATEEVMREMAGQGRAMKVFGPEVPVAADAPALHRALGLSGRDPAWEPVAFSVGVAGGGGGRSTAL
ncbi:TIGR03086 family metal-binding protein [Qaidamihabitans albus]|uniref:TIGR03086 family metal-binding protein n=1 Tax=Qaidamihabitans albus TaxID=2795733 RepID=UPI0018F26B76|nr:TIGR03086 family metal-binding protein [Qaidamihabitans albus]